MMFRSGFHFGDLSLPLFTVYGEEAPAFLAIGAALAVGEVFLARRKGAWPGLVLPGVFFAWAAVNCAVRMMRWHPVLDDLCFALLVENIPTAALLAVYAVCRIWRWRKSARRADKGRSLDKTRIEDL